MCLKNARLLGRNTVVVDMQNEGFSKVCSTWIRAVLEAMLNLVRSTYPLLELRGAQSLARLTSKAPFYCPTPRATLALCKQHLARQGAIPALLSELLHLVPSHATAALSLSSCGTVRFSSTTKVLAKRKLKDNRLSQVCESCSDGLYGSLRLSPGSQS